MADLLRISLMGLMPNGEEWSVNPVWGLQDFGTSVTPAEAATIATAIAGVSIPGGLLTVINSATSHNSVRVEARTRGGILETQAETNRPTPGVGTGTSPHPFQTSWVTSLRTAQVGASGRGRLYWPATGVTLTSSSLRPSSVNTASFVSDVKTYLSAIQTAIRITKAGAYLAVWSRKQVGLFAVNQLQAGDVLDTQRRRRDTLIETYQAATFP